jgi:hypothetical protein
MRISVYKESGIAILFILKAYKKYIFYIWIKAISF